MIVFTRNIKKGKFIETENKVEVTRDWERNCCLMGKDSV